MVRDSGATHLGCQGRSAWAVGMREAMSGENSSRPYEKPWRRWYAAVLLMAIYVCANLDWHAPLILAQAFKAAFRPSDSPVGLLCGCVFGLAGAVGALRQLGQACAGQAWSIAGIQRGSNNG